MKLQSPADIAALAPWLLGYELGHNDVVLVTLDRDQSSSAATGPTVMFACDELGPGLEDAVRDTARRIVNDYRGKPLAFTIGYGDNGDLLSSKVAETFQDALTIDTDTIPLHYDGSNVQTIAADGGKIDCGPLPDVSAEMTALGKPMPSASRTMKDREWHPDPVPSYEALPTSIAERLETFPPTERAEEAVRLARVLSAGESTYVQGDQRRLAGLINSSTEHWVSDRLMMEACTAPPRRWPIRCVSSTYKHHRSTSSPSQVSPRSPTTPSTATARRCARCAPSWTQKAPDPPTPRS